MNPVAEAIPSIADLPTPEGIQEEVVTLKPQGHAVVLGTSGSGKTVMAVLRALYLADPSHEHSGKTLLVTYNKSLLAYVSHLIPEGTTNLDACTYHQFARNYLDERGKMERGWTVLGNHKMGLVKKALEEVRGKSTDEILKKPTGFFVPELDWMVQNGYLTEESYLEADRVGRGPEISPESRKAVFQIQQAYWRLRSEVGKHYDWADMAAAVHAALKEDDGERRYTHVVIDEGQDFSPEMLRSLALAIPKEGSLTFFGDAAQQIYGRGISWRTAGLEVSKTWELTKNHRNSPEIAKLAAAIAKMPYFEDQPDVIAAEECAASGPPPTVVTLSNREAEEAFVVEQAEALAATGSVAVLCRRDSDATRIGEKLSQATHLHRDMSKWRPEPGVLYGNIHSAKGYEFQSVILVGVTKNKWPERRVVSAIGAEQASVMDGRLLHVAVTRARQNLIMTATRDLTPLLPANDGLWNEQKLGSPAKSNGKRRVAKQSAQAAVKKAKAAASATPQALNGDAATEEQDAPEPAAAKAEKEPQAEPAVAESEGAAPSAPPVAEPSASQAPEPAPEEPAQPAAPEAESKPEPEAAPEPEPETEPEPEPEPEPEAEDSEEVAEADADTDPGQQELLDGEAFEADEDASEEEAPEAGDDADDFEEEPAEEGEGDLEEEPEEVDEGE